MGISVKEWREKDREERDREILFYNTIEQSLSLESWVLCCPSCARDESVLWIPDEKSGARRNTSEFVSG